MVCSLVEDDTHLDRFDLFLRLRRLLFEIKLHIGICGRFGLRREFVFKVFEKSLAHVFIDLRDDVAGEIDDFLDFCCRESEHKSDTRRDAAEEPDVSDRCRKVDVTHAFAAHNSASDLHAALLADDPAETDTTVFTAVTFVIFFRTEYTLVEKTVLFGTLRTIIDGLRFCDLAVRPFDHSLGRCKPHCDRLKICRDDILSLGDRSLTHSHSSLSLC